MYKAADVGLFPIGKQGSWLAPFEMICAGKPIIVSDKMGAASVIKGDNLGVVTGNYSEAVLEIWDDYKKYKQQARNAAVFVKKNLSWGIFGDKMIKAYKDAWKRYN